MDKKTYFLVSAVVFALIAVGHAARVYFGWDAQIGGWVAPMWVSWAAVLGGGFLAWQGWQFKG